MSEDTIFALSSAPGRAGVAVLRISGAASSGVVEALTGRPCPPPRRASLRRFRDSRGEVIDRGILLWFPGPDSFTGEDLAEFQVHGGRAVIQGLLDTLAQQAGCRIAMAGEFTRRAFDAGKLDLAEVEGLADLIAADTEAQRRQALHQLEGGLSAVVAEWTRELTTLLAHVEAEIEFPDEGIEDELNLEKLSIISDAERKIGEALADRGLGERLREGFSAVLLGAPNVGKSSLMNLLAQRDVAIVSEEAGTTRDVIEVSLDLAGFPLTLADTAGLRSAAGSHDVGPIEAEGMRRTRKRAKEADLKVLVVDATAPDWSFDEALAGHANALLVANKTDLLKGQLCQSLRGGKAIEVSAKTGVGLDAIIVALRDRLSELAESPGDTPIVTRARHRQALEDCQSALRRARSAGSLELVAEDLRLALRELGRIVGQVDVEDILDVVFRDFCVGK